MEAGRGVERGSCVRPLVLAARRERRVLEGGGDREDFFGRERGEHCEV